MVNHFKATLKVLGMQILISLASFLFSKSFYWFLSEGDDIILSRVVIYSAITGFLLLSAVYSVMWDTGKQDNIPGSKPYMLKGFVISLMASVPALVLLLISLFNDYWLFDLIYKIYQFSFWGFMTLGNGNLLSCALVILPVVVVCTVAYILGYKKIKVYEDYISCIFYKNK